MGTLTKKHLNIGNRDYYLYLPTTLDPNPPVLIYFHGGGQGDPQGAFRQTGLDKLADSEKFVLVLALGTPPIPDTENGRTFNAGVCCGWAKSYNIDESSYFLAIREDMRANFCNIKRLYVCGISNGGILAQNLAYKHPNEIAGCCSISSGLGLDPTKLATNKPVPLLMFHGGKDTHYPYFGGSGPDTTGGSVFYSIPDTLNFWTSNNKASKYVQTIAYTGKNPVGFKNSYTPGLFSFGGKPVVLYFFPDGGHTWPGGVDLGSNGQVIDFNANKTMWDFLKGYSL